MSDDAAPQSSSWTTAGKRSGARVVAHSLAALAIAALVLTPLAAAVTPQETAAANSIYVGPDYAYGNANAAAQLCFAETTSNGDTDTPHPLQHAGAAIVPAHRYVSVFALLNVDGTTGHYQNSTGYEAWNVHQDTGTWTLTDDDASSGHDLTLARADAVNQTMYAGASDAPQFDVLAVAWTALPGDETSYFADEAGFSCSSGTPYFDDALTAWSSVACGPEQSAEGTTTRAIEATPGYAAKDTSANYPIWQAVAYYFDVTTLNGTEPTTCPTTHIETFTGGGGGSGGGILGMDVLDASTVTPYVVSACVALVDMATFFAHVTPAFWGILGALALLGLFAIFLAVIARARRAGG